MSSTEQNKEEGDKKVGSAEADSTNYTAHNVEAPITLADLLREKKEVESANNIDEYREGVARQEIRERETMRVGQEKYFKLRDKWSWFIFGYISFMLLFQLYLSMGIGYGWLNFHNADDSVFLRIVIGENFAQIVGMGIIVAKYLFPNNKG